MSNLHWCWDNLILLHWVNTELKSGNFKDEFVKFIEANSTFKQEFLTKQPNFVQIIEETRDQAIKYGYIVKSRYNVSNVSIGYYQDSWPIVKLKIMKSGLQMAKLLNDIFDQRSDSNKLSFNNYLLLISLILVLLSN